MLTAAPSFPTQKKNKIWPIISRDRILHHLAIVTLRSHDEDRRGSDLFVMRKWVCTFSSVHLFEYFRVKLWLSGESFKPGGDPISTEIWLGDPWGERAALSVS